MVFHFRRVLILGSILALAASGVLAADRQGRGDNDSEPKASKSRRDERPDGPRSDRGKKGGGFGAVLKEADTDGDGELTKKEFMDFQEALFEAADHSADGRLDGGEVAFLFSKMVGKSGRQGQNRPGGPGGQGRPGGFGGPPPIDGLIRNLDKDEDGKVAEDEATPQMQKNFDKLDADGDGYLDREELERAIQKMAGGRPGGGPGGGGGIKAMDTDEDGLISSSEAHGPLDENFDDIDQDADGNLSPSEIKEFMQNRPQGREQDRGQGRDRDDRGDRGPRGGGRDRQ